jgi:hypothetical protein
VFFKAIYGEHVALFVEGKETKRNNELTPPACDVGAFLSKLGLSADRRF